MADALLLVAVALWLAAAILALGGALTVSRVALAVGAAAGVAAAVAGLPDASEAVTLPGRLAGEAVDFRIAPQGLWLMGFGLVPAIFACSLASPMTGGGRGWLFGVALSLLGALGVFGLQNGAALLIAWEIMSLGGAVMVLSDNLGSGKRPSCSLHACASRSRRRGSGPRRRASRTARGRSRVRPGPGRRPGLVAARANRPRRSPHPRLRREAWLAAVLRMVPGRLWLGKRSVRRDHVGRRHECGVLRPRARA